MHQLLVVGVEGGVVLADTLQGVALVILAVGTVAGVDQEQRGALGDVQVGVVLVSEVCLQRPDGRALVAVADADQFVRVAAAAACQSDNLAKLGELRTNLAECPDIQVQERDAERTIR